MQVDATPGSRIARELTGSVGPTRYDLVLAAIPLSFLFGAAAGATLLPWVFALACGGVAAVGATAYGLFLAPPTNERTRTRRDTGRRRASN